MILWTCREGKELVEALEWSKKHGIVFDAINDNIPEQVKRYGCNSRKISCDIYLDDRAISTIDEINDKFKYS